MAITGEEVKVNQKYKDNLFRMLFGTEEHRDNLMSLINALYDKDYTDPSQLQITTMDDVLFINTKDDVSVLLDMRMYLFEQQATINPNMPVRGMIYFAHLYDKYIDNQPTSIYAPQLIRLPSPRYTVLYNGLQDAPARQELRLSEAFAVPAEGFEWTATFININAGKNEPVLAKCRPLWEYMQLIEKIRDQLAAGLENGAAVKAAVEQCIEEGILAEFLKKHKAEVYDVCLTEFDEKKYARTLEELYLKQGRAEGRAEGLQQGMQQGIRQGMQQGESNMSSLFSMLLSAGRLEEAKLASADPIYRAQLMQEYRIIPQ